MIRRDTDNAWGLVTHPAHAELAGRIADAWGNQTFPIPQPIDDIRYAVYHHDDGWLARDAEPCLTPSGIPEGFTRALVGAYSAFEEIDLPAYLKVRERATFAVAAVNLLAGVIVSMHTCNLLTEQADLASIRPEHRLAHANFITEQIEWQHATCAQLGIDKALALRGFEFLQCCDSLSLVLCSGYDAPVNLRHAQPDNVGERHWIRCVPSGDGIYGIDPWPFSVTSVELKFPAKTLPKQRFANHEAYRTAYQAATVQAMSVQLLPLI